MTMKNGFVFEAGLIEISRTAKDDKAGNDVSGALAAYNFGSAEEMHKVASSHNEIRRMNGKYIKGKNYTRRMAQNDWNA